MKLHLFHSLLALVAAAPCVWGGADPGDIVFVGDSITQGGKWAGAGLQPSYRYSLFKNMVDNGLAYKPMGIGVGSKTGSNVTTAAYRGRTFDNTHEASAGGRSYNWSGIPADNSGYADNRGSRPHEAPVWNLLGLENPQTGSSSTYYNAGKLQTYAGPTYPSKYGANKKPRTVCVLIGINDLVDVLERKQVVRADGSHTAYTYDDVIANTHAIVQAYQQYSPGADIVVMGLLPTKPGYSVRGMEDPYNEKLQAAAAEWGTATSRVTYACVSAGLGNKNHLDNWGAHPNSQGELLVAGNLADVLGIGQRTLGLGGKGSAEFTHRLDTAAAAGQRGFTVQGNSANISTHTDAGTGDTALLMQYGAAEGCTLCAGEWDVSAAAGYTVTASLQLCDTEGSGIQIRIGDGSVGDGLLRIAGDGIYWGDGNTLLYAATPQGMNDFRITYLAGGNAQGVAAGYYVWMNNQLIGEALPGATTKTAAFTLGAAAGCTGCAAIADLAWEHGNWVNTDTGTIRASKRPVSAPDTAKNGPATAPGTPET